MQHKNNVSGDSNIQNSKIQNATLSDSNTQDSKIKDSKIKDSKIQDSKALDSNVLDSKIIVALDYANAASALQLVNQLNPSLCKLKVGKELFTAAGPQLVETLVAKNFKVFLDLKFHDIPSTVAKACEAASQLGVWMLNVHASGGHDMMQAALEGVNKSANSPHLIAVTVLTSMNQSNLTEIGIETSLENQVLRLAKLAQQAGLHGVVCSAQEAQLLRKQLGETFCLVTPGIRSAQINSQVNLNQFHANQANFKLANLNQVDSNQVDSNQVNSNQVNSNQVNRDDQSRVVTPADALGNGASYLVIGRPITQAKNPLQALEAITAQCLAYTNL